MKKRAIDDDNFDMIVINKEKVGRDVCIEYHCNVNGTDFLEAVENFFEETGIKVSPTTVEKIAHEVFQAGCAFWRKYQFEMLWF